MEVGLDPSMPTSSGGLGILAGDTLRAAADLGLPMIGVTLLHRQGYLRQHLDFTGNQLESPAVWNFEEALEPMAPRILLPIEGQQVHLCAWRHLVRGVFGHTVLVYFLDTGLEDNSPGEQSLTDSLYGGNSYHRLCQEVVLGMGGIAMLDALGFKNINTFHMNEGHAAFLTLALLEQQTNGGGLPAATDWDREAVRQRCVFTTHTPVPAGHDQFSFELISRVLGPERLAALEAMHCVANGVLNMTYLALQLSRYINGVAMRHGEISRNMFPHYPIDSITNGVHALTWTSLPFRNLGFFCRVRAGCVENRAAGEVNPGNVVVVENFGPVGSSFHQVRKAVVNPDDLMTTITCLKGDGTDGTIDPRGRPSANDYADSISHWRMTT